jgi:transposase-like protein
MGAITTEVVETGDKRDTRGRRMATVERRAQLVAAYQASGLTMAAFARREGVKYATFAHWVLKAQKATTPAKPRIRFAELQLPLRGAAVEPLEIRLPDGTVLRGTRVADLAALVRALRA